MKKQSVRKIFFIWLIREVVKVPEGLILPKWARILYRMLFPLDAYLYNNSTCCFDPCRLTIKIVGIQYSIFFFENLAFGKPGTVFRLIDNKDGILHIEKLPEEDLVIKECNKRSRK